MGKQGKARQGSTCSTGSMGSTDSTGSKSSTCLLWLSQLQAGGVRLQKNEGQDNLNVLAQQFENLASWDNVFISLIQLLPDVAEQSLDVLPSMTSVMHNLKGISVLHCPCCYSTFTHLLLQSATHT
jgi:hypothetical protein